MFIDRINKAFPIQGFQQKKIHFSENCDQLKIKYSSSSLMYDYEGVKELFGHIPERDKLTAEVSYGEDESIQINLDNFENNYLDEIQRLNDYLSDDEELEVKITIQKEIQQARLSIYDFSKFSSWFFDKGLMDFLECCNMLKKDYHQSILFECLDDDVSLRGGFINFASEGNEVNILDSRQIRIDPLGRQEVCGIVSDISIIFTPDDFHIVGQTRNFPKKYINYLNWLEMIFSLAYISNQSIFTKDTVQVILKGYRLVEDQVNFQQGEYNHNFFNIYDWVYSAGNLSDKVTLARNLISLSCKWKSILVVDEAVLPAIQSNYNLYIQGNVKDYLTLKKEVSTTLQNYCNNVSNAINKYTGGLKANFIAFLGYITTLLFTKGIQKDTTAIFTQEISILTSIILVGSLLICFISIIELCLKYRYFNKMIEGLKSQYSDVMEEAEIKRVVDDNPLLCTAKSNFWWSLGIVSVIWIISILVLFLLLDLISGEVKLLFFFDRL